MSHTTQNKKALITRVRRIGGQVASLERALQSDADCDSVLQQAASIRGAVQGLMSLLLEDHLREHVAGSHPDALKELEPVMAILRSYLR
ncbi:MULTISPECIES: metal/formaldehyde-sensitive transcriptional repressor [Dyella]|uniref:Metal/formaldehyde-sensitive transcriptional repressor n=2 Tax=Dyella TaxID=231454 RepID=A0A4R0YXU3_9GAMM|nr:MULTISPECIES: metal/formaldehyde-sensitive transcriptional repressor [Dyella]TBR38987.1 metal/formaldehyde-sensitive transcriptional repressor [Dyella terrae]TCI13421.1 metal/formaldehyde-sensitive transcriptional repressor [Dyella soli]